MLWGSRSAVVGLTASLWVELFAYDDRPESGETHSETASCEVRLT